MKLFLTSNFVITGFLCITQKYKCSTSSLCNSFPFQRFEFGRKCLALRLPPLAFALVAADVLLHHEPVQFEFEESKEEVENDLHPTVEMFDSAKTQRATFYESGGR